MKAIIYARKSTDREELQQNSIEHQLINSRNTANQYKLEIVDEIIESKSAKVEFTRDWFNQLIKYCKTWKIDYIIIDEPKRLSRNTIDTSRIIDLMDKSLIIWVLWTWRRYLSENSRDKFLFQLDLSISKMDNEDRSKDVKAKMQTILSNWRFTGKAPLWYKNFGPKWKKEIVIDVETKHFVEWIFKFRSEWYWYKEIWEKMYQFWLKNKIGKPLPPSSIKDIINNKFYIWIMKFNDYIWKHNHWNIIDLDLFNQVNDVRWYTPTTNPRDKFPLKWIIFDEETKKPLIASETKGNIYYKTHSRSKNKINISQKQIIEAFNDKIENYSLNPAIRESIISWLKNYYWDLLDNNKKQITNLESNIKKLSDKKEKILDLYCEWWISAEDYKKKINEIELESLDLNQELWKIMSLDQKVLDDCWKVVQLLTNLKELRKNADENWKATLLSIILVQLFIDTKKQLYIQENELFETIKIFNFNYGGTKRNWTAVRGVADPCMNHSAMAP